MLRVDTLQVGVLGTNCYVVRNTETGEGFAVDPGDEGERILTFIREQDVKLTHILLTHGHFDHFGAAKFLRDATGAPVCIHKDDENLLEDGDRKLFRALFGTEGPEGIRADITLFGEITLEAAGESWTVIHTPGHTPGSCCFDNGKLLFCGDTLFAASCGRTDFIGGSREDMELSLARLTLLPGDRQCYSGHDRAFTLEEARKSNPVLWGILR